MDNKNFVLFLEVLAKYCMRYLDKRDAEIICGYFTNKSSSIIRVIKNTEYLDVDLYVKIDFIVSKIKTDVFEHNVQVYHIRIPYDNTNIEEIDYKTLCLDCCDLLKCCDLYENINNPQANPEGNFIMIGFERRILDLLLPPKQGLLFNHDEWSNKDTLLMESLYTELKKRDPDIVKEYGKSFREFSREEFVDLVDKKIKKTSKHLSVALWIRARKS